MRVSRSLGSRLLGWIVPSSTSARQPCHVMPCRSPVLRLSRHPPRRKYDMSCTSGSCPTSPLCPSIHPPAAAPTSSPFHSTQYRTFLLPPPALSPGELAASFSSSSASDNVGRGAWAVGWFAWLVVRLICPPPPRTTHTVFNARCFRSSWAILLVN